MNRKYTIGKLFKICEGSGLASNKFVKIIPWFNWHKATDGTYYPPDRKEKVAIQFENGDKGFMFKTRLIAVTEEDIFDAKI